MRRFAVFTTLALFACALLAAPASARLAVVANGKTQVKVVDLGRKKVVARPHVGLPARAVALTLDGLRAYVVASGSTAGQLTAIDLVTRTVVGDLPVPAGSRGVALAPDGLARIRDIGWPARDRDGRRPRHGRNRRADPDAAGVPPRSRCRRTARAHMSWRQAQAGPGRRRGHEDGEDDPGRHHPVLAGRRPSGARVYVTSRAAGGWR